MLSLIEGWGEKVEKDSEQSRLIFVPLSLSPHSLRKEKKIKCDRLSSKVWEPAVSRQPNSVATHCQSFHEPPGILGVIPPTENFPLFPQPIVSPLCLSFTFFENNAPLTISLSLSLSLFFSICLVYMLLSYTWRTFHSSQVARKQV